MGFKIVKPDEPTHKSLEIAVLPKDEARRYRQAAREMADAMLPTAMRRLAQMLEAEDDEVALKAIKEIARISLAGSKSNEDLDDHEVVQGTVVKDDPVAALEAETENGDGSGE